MRTSHKFFWLLTILLSGTAGAQVLDWSNPQRISSKNAYSRLIGKNQHGIYVLRCRKSDFKDDLILEKYKESLGIDWSKPLQIERGGERIEKVIILDDGLFVFKQVSNFQNGQTEIWVKKLSFEGLDLLPYTEIESVRTLSFFDTDEKFKIQESENKKSFIVYYSQTATKDRLKLVAKQFDLMLKKFSDGTYTLDENVDEFYTDRLILTPANKLFILCTRDDEKDRRKDEIVIKHYLISMDLLAGTSSKSNLNISGKIEGEANMNYQEEKSELIVAGFFSEKKSNSSAGYFVYKINVSSGAITSNYQRFPKELLARLLGEKKAEKEKEVEDFMVNRIIPRSDGGVLIIAECFYMVKQPYSYVVNGSAQNSYRNVYYYDEIMILSVDSVGTLDWSQVINKSQSSVNDGGYSSSFVCLVQKEAIHFYINERFRSNNQVLEYSLNSFGELKNKLLLKSANYYIDIVPKESMQIASNSILLVANKDRRFSLLKITY